MPTVIKGKVYSPITSRVIVSNIIDYDSGVTTIVSAKLNATYTGDIDFFMSVDAGVHWEKVVAGTAYTFENTGNQLKWKGILTGVSTELTYLWVSDFVKDKA